MDRRFLPVTQDRWDGTKTVEQDIGINIAHILYITFSDGGYPEKRRVLIALSNGDAVTVSDPDSFAAIYDLVNNR